MERVCASIVVSKVRFFHVGSLLCDTDLVVPPIGMKRNRNLDIAISVIKQKTLPKELNKHKGYGGP